MKVLRRPVLVVLCGLLAVLWVGMPTASSQTAPALTYSIRTSGADLSNAQDGDPLRITISGLPAGATANFKVCPTPLRDSLVTFPGAPDHSMANRVLFYCPAVNDELTGSVFATPAAARGRSAASGDVVFDTYVPRGSSSPQNIVRDPEYTSLSPSASITWPNNPNNNKYSFTCDETHPCTVMLTITGTPPGASAPQTVYDDSIQFAPSAPGLKIQGCGSIDTTSTLTASMPERFGKTAVAWNQMLCAPTKSALPANIVNETEDVGLTSFDKGESDVVVTGSGGALASQSVRKRQYVPVGLNATVIAAIGWAPTDRTDQGATLMSRLSTNLAFSWDDIANILSKGGQQPDSTGRGGIFLDGSPLVSRNPALAAISGTNGPADAPQHRAGYFGDPSFYGVTGEAGKSTVPLSLSNLLASDAVNSWVYGTTDVFEGRGGKPVGTVTDLNDLNLGLPNTHNVEAKTGRINVRKAVDAATVGVGVSCANGCLNWVVTDLASAIEYGWTPMAVPNGQGGFVAPTVQSLQAAAAHMTTAEDGSIVPGDTSGDPNAYPLTFAESMTVPVNPLIDEDCRPQQAKQDQLATFLKAAVNGGQSSMGSGMVPLTPDLLSLAQDGITKVGTGTAAAACEEEAAAQNPDAASLTDLNGTGGTFPGGFTGTTSPGTGGLPTPAAGPPAALTQVPTAASVQAAQNLAQSVRIPLFPGAGVLAALIPLLALVVLVMLPSATAYLAAGRPVPPWLTRLLERLAEGLSRFNPRARPASARGDA